MVTPVVPVKDARRLVFPPRLPFLSLYPITAAVKAPMRDSDLRHAGKGNSPTSNGQAGEFLGMINIGQGKERENRRNTS